MGLPTRVPEDQGIGITIRNRTGLGRGESDVPRARFLAAHG